MDLGGLTQQQISIFAILIVAFALLLTERLRNDLVAVLIVVALYFTGVLEPREALSGFSSEPAIVVAGIFVLSGGLHQTGISEVMGRWIGRFAGDTLTRALAVIMTSVALLSAFTHHLTMTAVMLPITLSVSRDRGIPASRLLMPVSFAASLGTAITIIGAPAFIIASGVLQQNGRPGLSVFSIAPIGLALTAAGTLYMILAGRFLLPAHQGGEEVTGTFRLEGYFTELIVPAGSAYLDKQLHELGRSQLRDSQVVGWIRDSHHLRRPFETKRLQAGDILLIRTTPGDIVAIQQQPGFELHPIVEYGGQIPRKEGEHDVAGRLAQAVIAPSSELIGRTIGQTDFLERYDVLVVGLWRQEGWLGDELSKIRLAEGDVLVLQGSEQALAGAARDRAFLMMVPFQGEARLRRKAPLAAMIMLATIVAASLNLVPLEMAVLTGAAAMVLTRCITGRQAYRAIDARIYVFIAGAIPLGLAMQKSGASDMLAGWLEVAIGGWSTTLVLLALFAIVGIVTQFMSDSATTALFAPVAVALAGVLGRSPEAFVVTVAMASVVSFLTPIGHHGNLLVYGPGRYRFSDFVKVGTPLTVISALIVALLAPVLWPA